MQRSLLVLSLTTILTLTFYLFYVIHYSNHFNSTDVSDAYDIGLLNEYMLAYMYLVLLTTVRIIQNY